MRKVVRDPLEAERLVSQTYLPHRVDLGRDPTPLAMELRSMRVGALTVGRLSYGRRARVVTAETQNFHVNVPVRGALGLRSGSGEVLPVKTGQAGVYGTGVPADLMLSDDCDQLGLMMPRATLEATLERLLDQQLDEPLRMEFLLDLTAGPGRLWRGPLRMLLEDLAQLDGDSRSHIADRHLEAVVLERLLLAQLHNYTEAMNRQTRSPGQPVVRRAIELMEDRPEEPWTVISLATETHVSVRTLQHHFQQELDVSPTAYLRGVRLRSVRQALLHPTREDTTVASVAKGAGFLHQGRFAALYRATYGESPSATLRRSRDR